VVLRLVSSNPSGMSPQLLTVMRRIRSNWAPPPQSEAYRQVKRAAAELTMPERNELRAYLDFLDGLET
jgi:hypothetical protein